MLEDVAVEDRTGGSCCAFMRHQECLYNPACHAVPYIDLDSKQPDVCGAVRPRHDAYSSLSFVISLLGVPDRSLDTNAYHCML